MTTWHDPTRESFDPLFILTIQHSKSYVMSIKVLVADDSGTMRKIIIRSLNSVGVTDVVEARDGTEAFELFQQHKCDLVLTDWNMPGQTGLDLLKSIRSVDPNVPVILITTESGKSRVLMAVEAGVSDYLVKPFDSDALREKLDKFVAV